MEEILKDYRFFYKNLIYKSFVFAVFILLALLLLENTSYFNGYVIGYFLGVFNFYLLSKDVELFGKKDMSPRKARLFSFSRYGLRFFTVFAVAYVILEKVSLFNPVFMLVGFFTIKFVVYIEFIWKKKVL
jgi:hypothetical protein